MSWKEKLKEEGQKEKAKLKNMSWQDRVWYIWEYYKIHIAVIGIGFLFLYLVWTIAYNSTFTTRLSYAVVNDSNPETAGLEALDQAFKAYMGYGKKDKVELNSSLRIDTDGRASELGYASMAKISALVALVPMPLPLIWAGKGSCPLCGGCPGAVSPLRGRPQPDPVL